MKLGSLSGEEDDPDRDPARYSFLTMKVGRFGGVARSHLPVQKEHKTRRCAATQPYAADFVSYSYVWDNPANGGHTPPPGRLYLWSILQRFSLV